MKRVLWVLVLAACSSSPAATPPVAPPESEAPELLVSVSEPVTLRGALIELAGDAPVLLVATEAGLVARTPDRVLRVLADGAVEEAGYDAATELVFLRREGRLEVLDLREADPRPVTLVRDLPDDTPVHVEAGGRIVHGETPRSPEYLILHWSAEPSLELEFTIEDLASEEIIAEARRATVVGTDWLVANQGRSLAAPGPEPRDADRVSIPTGRECYDEEECGVAQHFGTTGWQLFVAHHDCGDYCYWDCLLLDPATGKVALPTETEPSAWREPSAAEEGGSCTAYRFDREQARFGHADLLCTPGAGCQSMGGSVLGFLDPGPTVVLSP